MEASNPHKTQDLHILPYRNYESTTHSIRNTKAKQSGASNHQCLCKKCNSTQNLTGRNVLLFCLTCGPQVLAYGVYSFQLTLQAFTQYTIRSLRTLGVAVIHYVGLLALETASLLMNTVIQPPTYRTINFSHNDFPCNLPTCWLPGAISSGSLHASFPMRRQVPP